MADKLVHTDQCWDAWDKYVKLLMTFITRYPRACRGCGGKGYSEHVFDPSPPGVSLSPGQMTDDDPCPECEGAAEPICALCGAALLFDPAHGELRRACGCPYDAVEPQRPECFCWQVLVDEAMRQFFLKKGGE